ncbi:AraC family transcriptional regulator [Leifsonia sp. YAF41]|uniref:AraC family transcriptional regulator n=1 Tax=Leifsonia sp. YAF41 TaxID=3233086 RepID=UPI003F96BC02
MGTVAATPFQAETILDTLQTVMTHDPESARDTISRLFVPHDLQPLERPRRLAFELRSAQQDDVGLNLLDYGTAVRISAEPLSSFVLVQIPLSGHAELEVGGRTHCTTRGQASIPPVDAPFRLTWHGQTPHLIVYMGVAALDRVATAMFPDHAGRRSPLPTSLDLTTPAGSAFAGIVAAMHEDVNSGSNAAANPFARTLVQEAIMMRFLLAATERAPEQAALSGYQKSRLVRRLLAVLDARSAEPLTPMSIAQELGVPLRSLQIATQQELGSTVTTLLLEARLTLVRARLASGDPTRQSVTEIALSCGFTHLGRFSSRYRAAYGESPSSTLRR